MATQPNTIVRLCDYCVAEFFPEDVSMSSQVFCKLYNRNYGTHHIFNDNGSPTGNSQDYSATYLMPGTYLYLNQEVAVPYWTRYPETFLYTTPGAYDTYNKVRFHFVSGFDFGQFEGLMMGVKNRTNIGSYAVFANVLVTPTWYSDVVKFNASPIYLADAVFDKYVEVFVPAIRQINLDYYATEPALRGSTFGGSITYNGQTFTGLVQDAPIVVFVDECNRIDSTANGEDHYDYYILSQHYESVVQMDAIYQLFGAFIGESQNFDAIEFYGVMTDDSGNLAFPTDLINALSTNAHDSWVIAHQLTIHEWVGGSKTMTGTYMHLQESDFDTPMYYRPVLKYAGAAVAFDIDYTCRLFNRRNGEQTIRTASFISYNPRKYGMTRAQLPLAAPVSSHVVYNKIIKTSLETTDLFVEQNVSMPRQLSADGAQQTARVTSFVPLFFNGGNISVSHNDYAVENSSESSSLIYKQGEMRFVLNAFDNMLKFKVYTVGSAGKLVPMDLNGIGGINIVFINDGKKVKFAYMPSGSNLANGDISFKVPQADAEQIVNSDTRDFYITVVASDNTETVLYTGFWNTVLERDEVDRAADKARVANEASADVNKQAEEPARPVLDASAVNSVSVPGYVQQGGKSNDVSVVQSIPPASYTAVSSNSKQTKADAALSSALDKQSGLAKSK